MSATIIHHGHIRLINKASRSGNVIIALTKDKEIKKFKGYIPEIKFKHRKEILVNIKKVYKVIPSNFYITSHFLKKNKIHYLVHGNDNKNIVEKTLMKFGKIDILVNNSGGPRAGTFFDFEEKDWDKAHNDVLKYTMRMISLVTPHMKNNHWGIIINITSLSVKEPAPTLILSNIYGELNRIYIPYQQDMHDNNIII